MNKITSVVFNECDEIKVVYGGLWQYDYGQILRIEGLDLPAAVEIHFSLQETGGDAKRRIGITKSGVTDVVIPDFILEGNDATRNYDAYAFIYLSDEESGETTHKIKMQIKSRSKPEGSTGSDETSFGAIMDALKTFAAGKADGLKYENSILKLMSGEAELARVTIKAGEGTGSDAREIELQKSDTAIQWRYTGDEEWTDLVLLEELKGEKGDPGEGGKTAYQYAQDGGYTGTEEEFAKKLAQENPTREEFSRLSDTVADLKQNGTGTGTGLTANFKSALMEVVENIGLWKDGNGDEHIEALRTALYSTSTLESITVVYTQNKTVYATDSLDVLKSDLVVTGTYTDGSSATITSNTLSGTLTVGTSIITVSKDGKTATFEVTVTASRVPATGITFDKTTLSFTGSTPIQLTATVEPSNTTDTVTWSSSEDAVATVEDGLVTPQADGSCKIYATAGDITVECSVSVALPLSGINIGNPFLTKVDGMPSSVATTEEEAQGKWYKALFTAWTTSLGIEKTFFLHPLTNGTYYIRMVGRTLSDPIEFYAFQNADIGLNPTATLGKVGGDYTNATVTKFTSFDSEYTNSMGNVDLGEWTYVDNSGTTYTSSIVALYKVVVPEDVYVFMATSEMGANRFPGISENHPYMNDLYTIFDSDPSANILQVVE